MNRVKTANTTAPSLWGDGAYNYDAMGNLTSLALGTARTASFSYSGTLPKLTSVTETGFGTRNVTYDPTGNETQVGTGVFAYSSRNFLSNADGLTYTYDGRGLRTMVVNSDVTPAKRYFFYSPEMNLLSESELTTLPAPPVLYDYVFFNGHPVGQVNGGTQWAFTDHLGTPLIQTDSLANVFWRAEHEPYGRVFSLRGTPDQHQPLRLPGQEAEQLNLGENGASERFYNIFRWYRYGWGRYTQSDPMGLKRGLHLFGYGRQNPVRVVDRRGLVSWSCSYNFTSANLPVGPGFGALITHCTSECACGKSLTLELSGALGGISISPLPIPLGTASSSITLKDSNSCPTECLAGFTTLASGGIVIGIGFSYTELNLGCATGRTTLSSSGLFTVGLDVGLDVYAGYSGIVYRSSSQCCPKGQ